jgi:hypothetical protein
MKRRTIFISLLIVIALYPIIVSSAEETYFYALKRGNIYREKDVRSEIVGEYIEEDFFLFSYEKNGWVCLWRADSKKSYQRIGYTLEENGMIVTYDRLLQLAKESNKKYDKPATRKPQRELSRSGEEIKKLLTNKEVRIGMTAEQVTRLCGKPNRINETVDARAKSEQWIYGSGIYLHFENGILTSYSLSR